MRVLVTGHCGLIGSELVKQLHLVGAEPFGIDLRGTGDERGDITDRHAVAFAMQRCDVVVHLAAWSRPVLVERDPFRARLTNVRGTETVVAAAEKRGCPIIYASSREVYGEQAHWLSVQESTELAPVNEYGRQKVACEYSVAASLVPSTVVRFSNVYGSTSDWPDRVIPAFVRGALLGQMLRVEGAESAFDFTYVADAARLLGMLCQCLASGQRAPQVLNCCTGTATSLLSLAKLVCDVCGGGTLQVTEPRTGDPSWFCGDAARAHKFGWTHLVELQTGLSRLAQDYGTISNSETA
jgi:UDP-glucose 4-epimerase